MKLIIELDERQFKDIQRIASIQIRRRSLTCEQIIANGTPLEEELEKIKAEIEQMDFDFGNYYDNSDLIIEKVSKVIDNHIAELKGENNAE